MRQALKGLKRYIVTSATAKQRVFTFVDGDTIPDNALVVIASDDAYVLGVLSSSVHRDWEKSTSSHMGKAYRYTQATTFDTFAFPDATEEQKQKIREIAEKLDNHRKAMQADHPRLTLTSIHNSLEKLNNSQLSTIQEQDVIKRSEAIKFKTLYNILDIEVSKIKQ